MLSNGNLNCFIGENCFLIVWSFENYNKFYIIFLAKKSKLRILSLKIDTGKYALPLFEFLKDS